MLNGFDSATIDKAGDALKGKIVMFKNNDTILPSPFEADAKRFKPTELDTLPDYYTNTADEIQGYKKAVGNYYNILKYFEVNKQKI